MYFVNPNKIATIHQMAVSRDFRGRGLATFMHLAAVYFAHQVLKCDYLYADMISAETIHISNKFGFKHLGVLTFDQLIKDSCSIKEESEVTDPKVQKFFENLREIEKSYKCGPGRNVGCVLDL